MTTKSKIIKAIVAILALSCFVIFSSANLFAAPANDTVGTIFKNIGGEFGGLVNFLFSLATIAGLCFSIAALLKFKQHKDNPAQVTIGQPIGLFFLGAIMLWLPFIIQSLGTTILGNSDKAKEGQSRLDSGPKSGFGKYLIDN